MKCHPWTLNRIGSSGQALVQVMIAAGVLSVVALVSAGVSRSMFGQSTGARRNFQRANFEQKLVALYNHQNLCSCNIGAATPLSVPAAGSVDVPGLRTSCPGAVNDFYQSSVPGFPLDPSLSVQSISISNPVLVSGVSYNATLTIKYKSVGTGLVDLKDGVYVIAFDRTAVVGPPYTISTCSVEGPAAAAAGTGWNLAGNAGNAPTQFLGTLDDVDLQLRRFGAPAGLLSATMTALGVGALGTTNTGLDNTAAGNAALGDATTGNSNTAVGPRALTSNDVGSFNSALGFEALRDATGTNHNSALGARSLSSIGLGVSNTAVGAGALQATTDGSDNVAVGNNALVANLTGSDNVGLGVSSLAANTSGSRNTASGFNSLVQNTTGSDNVAAGANSLQSATTGSGLTAVGVSALQNNTTGTANSAAGYQALMNNTTGSNNSALGANALVANTTGGDNEALGTGALASNTNGNFNVAIGSQALQSSDGVDGLTAIGFGALKSSTNTAITWAVAVGARALENMTTGYANTGVGWSAGQGVVSGGSNTAIGSEALKTADGNATVAIGYAAARNARGTALGSRAMGNATGLWAGGTAIGYSALNNISSGFGNTAAGGQAMLNTSSGGNNTALGSSSMLANVSGSFNSAAGVRSLNSNVSGSNNSAFGGDSLASNVSGQRNVAVGTRSLNLSLGSYNTAIGYGAGTGSAGLNALINGDKNTFVGRNSGVVDPSLTYTNATAIGANALVGANNTIVLGAAGVNVGIGTANPGYQLTLSNDSAAKPGSATWTVASDERLKDVRAPFVRGLESLNGLRPIYYNYKKDNPMKLPSDTEFVGILAQDAQTAVPESVTTNSQGYLQVKTDALIWTLLNAVKELYARWTQESQDLHGDIARHADQIHQLEETQNNLENKTDELAAYFCQKNPRASLCKL